MKKMLIVIALVIIFNTGCSHVTELDEKSFVTAIGIDKGENYNHRFTFVFTNPSKAGETAEGKGKDETIVIEAPSLYSAVEQINNFKSKAIELTHTQTIIFSEELAKEGISEYIYMLVRSSHFRPNTYICIADDSSMEFLENVNPSQVYHLEKYFQLIFNKMTSNKKGDMYLYDSYFRLLSESEASVLPFCDLSHTTVNIPPSEMPTDEAPSESPSEEIIEGRFIDNTDDFAINIVAGDIIKKSENKAEIQGVAVIKQGRLKAVLGRMEAIYLQLVTNSMPKNYLTISNPKEPDKMITCYIVQSDAPEIKVKCGSVPEIDVVINLEGDFSEVGKNDWYIENPSQFEESFEKKTKEGIERFLYKTSSLLDCDICAFSEVAKSQFLTVGEWKAYNWKEKFKNAKYNVRVNLTMRTYGELAQKRAEE